MTTRIDWEAASPKPSWFFGNGATAAERALPCAAAAFGTGVLLLTALDLDWSWWRTLIGVLLVVDLAGGVVANGLNAAKRFYHGPLPLPPPRLNRLLHNEIGFAAVHLQPILIGLVFGGPWWWGPLWYAWALAGVVLVARSPLYLARPVSLLVALCGVLVAPELDSPAGFGWLPAVLLLKLVVAHAVPEEPYGRQAVR